MPFDRLKRLSLIDRKLSPEKWLREIQHTSRGLSPVPTHDDGLMFPWGQIRLHTDAFLSKRDLSEVQRDEALLGLIELSSDKVVGLAACSRHLSAKALLEILKSFQHAPRGDTGQFPQAFVAASHGNTEIFSPQDESWATVLVRVISGTTDCSDVPPIPAIRLLLNKWCTPPLPAYRFLRDVVRVVTVNLLQTMSNKLDACMLRKDWDKAIELSACLTDVSGRRTGLPQELQDILDWHVDQWRNWNAWRPDQQRLWLWRDFANSMPIKPFWNALGPDFGAGSHVFETAMARVTARGHLVEWMEQNGLKPGFDIICCDAIEVAALPNRLLNVLDSSCRLGDIACRFLQHIAVSDEGLDRHTLQLWHDATNTLLSRSPTFLSTLLEFESGPTDSITDQSFDSLANGLADLSGPANSNLRDFLRPQISHLMKKTAVSLKLDFATAVNTNVPWLEAAEKIRAFRALLVAFDSIYDVEIQGMNVKQQAACTTRSLEVLQELHTDILERCTDKSFYSTVTSYVTHVVLGTGHEVDDGLRLVAELHNMWRSASLMEYRTATLYLVSLGDISLAHRRDLVVGVGSLSLKHEFKLETCLMEYPPVGLIRLCYRIVRLAAQILMTNPATSEAWRAVVRHVMFSYSFIPPDNSHFTKVSFKKYRNWIRSYHAVFGDSVPDLEAKHQWVDQLVAYKADVESIYTMEGSEKAIHCMYNASKEPYSIQVVQMLRAIHEMHDPDRDQLMRHCVLSLTDNAKHLASISQAVVSLANIPDEGFQLCKKLTVIAAQESVYVAAVQKDVWLGLTLGLETKRALKSVAEALRLPPSSKAETAKDYFFKRVQQVMKEAKVVEDMRMKLSQSNRKGVSAVMATLMIEEQSSAVEEEILDLSNDLLNVIEQVQERTVELSFPLSYMSLIQRKAWGLAAGESVVVRLSVSDNGNRTAFCAHVVNPSTDLNSRKHDPVDFGISNDAPNTLRCEGRCTRLTYMIMRSLWYWLRRDDCSSLANLYQNVDSLIRTGRSNCIVCNQSHSTPAKTYRPSVCIKPNCRSTWLLSALELRLADLRLDPEVGEMLLAAIHAAATTMSKGSGSMELLPDRPSRINDARLLLNLLDKIPSISTHLKTIESLYQIRNKYTIRGELLLSWVLNSPRAFLMSAPPALQIPNMPGAKQFIVCDNPPEIVAAFAQHDSLQPRQVLFHGTTIDRLYAILCQGLKILSHTSFQSHGAAYGTGIYLAENPSTAISYSKTCTTSNPIWIANHSTFINHKVLLGIEYAGNDVSKGGGIHVATDPTKLLLRYVFLIQSSFKAPIAQHIVPAMQSNFHTLKSGAKAD